ncbi:Crp/Fnr family transcriptional regulator [Sphingomonas sp. 35-24ZXX]|uniref:Crp/Fnr family transcriptional regulator n=1 Tax=Sphingomonas sp. 35-24ZXX TaxID=1545915 RepID=UPI0018CDBAC9|nr:Crp/Fnr family transcriptional regulator [Sphingomonas sp. 35-24ZXX]
MAPEAASDLVAAMLRRTYAAGQGIYEQDASGSEMYRIVTGHVRLLVRDADGREAVFLQFGPGDFFGVSSLVDGEARPHSAEAVTSVELDVVGHGAFSRLRSIHPSFNDALIRLFARQMRVASEQLVAFHLCSLRDRVIRRLIELARGNDTAHGGHGMIEVAVSQIELAALAGASRQRVNKVLGELQAGGLISLRKGAIVLHDKDRLQSTAVSPR